jgi:hypothetical protein
MVEQGEALVFTERPSLNLRRMRIIDGRVLRTGSANFNRSGETRQDNDLVALRGAAVCAGFDASSIGLGPGAEKGATDNTAPATYR